MNAALFGSVVREKANLNLTGSVFTKDEELYADSHPKYKQ